MDGLSEASSIIALLQLNDVKDAPKECQRCMTEASNLQSLLINLLYHLNQGKTGGPWYIAIRALSLENGPLDQYKRLLWKFSKEEVASILTRMERLKSLEGTGQWFLDSPETLFCPGIPGAGKTIIAAIAIDYLCRTIGRDDIRVAYLLDIAALVAYMYDHHLKRRSKPSLDDIFAALNGARGRLIDKLRELQARIDVRLLFTSRFIPDITQKFQLNPILEVRASEEDVRRFVELKHAVQNKIVKAVNGMFLLARLYVDSLLDKRNKLLLTKELCQALAIEPGDKTLNNGNIYDVEDIISVCAGLVIQ
ncbi:ankyrin repeat domain-containing protein [Cenococcum geophilum]